MPPLSAAPLPLYFQLQQQILERIRSGEFRPEQALPTEADRRHKRPSCHNGRSRTPGTRALCVARTAASRLNGMAIAYSSPEAWSMRHRSLPLVAIRLRPTQADELAPREKTMSDWLMILADPLYLIIDLVLDSPLGALVLTAALGAIVAATVFSSGSSG